VESIGEAASPFDYDRSSPLDVREVASSTRAGNVLVRDITYAPLNPARGRLAAYIVSPPGEGPFAGILYFHWLGEKRSDRTQFLDEAVMMARRGVVSVLVQGYFPWTEKPIDGPRDRQRVIDQVIDTRRAMDLLVSHPRVDLGRVAYVGHDYGAMYGAIIAGIERRARAYVFMAGTGTFADWSLTYWPATAAAGEAAYRKAIADVEPIDYVGVASPAALFFQFAKADKYISEAEASEFFDQASQPKEQRWYDARHDLDVEAAAFDRGAWLARQLQLAGAD
jgi:dienelactone hydrolase